jgi:hypothetical protein
MHPAAVKAMKDTIKQLLAGKLTKEDILPNWVSAKT